MPGLVVDTDVASYVFKKDTRARPYHRHLVGQPLILSFMTLAELRRWALRRRWGPASRARLERHLQAYRSVLKKGSDPIVFGTVSAAAAPFTGLAAQRS
jgi:predicted nucleic acid-binding protein